MSHEIYVKFSVDDTKRFYDWLHDGINKHAAGYDAFYTLVKDGVASRDFDPHLDIEAREAIAIAEVLCRLNDEDNDDTSQNSDDALDCDDSANQIEVASTKSIDRISSALNALYSE